MIAILTYYVDTCTASGKHCGGSNIAAPRRFAFGTRIEFTAADGRKVVGVVAARAGQMLGLDIQTGIDRFEIRPSMLECHSTSSNGAAGFPLVNPIRKITSRLKLSEQLQP